MASGLRTGFSLKSQFASSREQGTCPGCLDSIVICDNQTGDEICQRCGRILQDRMLSEEQEWRSFANESNSGQDKNRVGGPNDAWLDDAVGGTTIAGADRRLQQLHDMATSASGADRLLKTSFENLRRVAGVYNLKEGVIERGKEMLKYLSDQKKLQKRTGEKYMLAILYLACREHGVTRTLKELCAVYPDITDTQLGKTVKTLQKILPVRGVNTTHSASELMGRYCNRLDLSAQVQTVAEYAARNAELVLTKVHRPPTLAGAIILLVTGLQGLGISIHEIANCVQSAESTIKDTYKELCPHSKSLLPPEFKFKPASASASR